MSFSGVIDANFQEKINKELKYQKFRYYNTPARLLENNVSPNNLYDTDSTPILDTVNNLITK
jgi:hypothetical protein